MAMDSIKAKIKERFESGLCLTLNCNKLYTDEVIELDAGVTELLNEEFTDEQGNILPICTEVTHIELNQLLKKELRLGYTYEGSAQQQYARTPAFLAAIRRYRENHPDIVKKQNASESQKEAKRRYKETEKGGKSRDRYEKSSSFITSQLRYKNSDKGKLAKARELEQRKINRRILKGLTRIAKNMCVVCDKVILGEFACIEHKDINEFFLKIKTERGRG